MGLYVLLCHIRSVFFSGLVQFLTSMIKFALLRPHFFGLEAVRNNIHLVWFFLYDVFTHFLGLKAIRDILQQVRPSAYNTISWVLN